MCANLWVWQNAVARPFIMSKPMTQYDKFTLDDLKRHKAQVKRQILDSAGEIRTVLVHDVPRWIEREARKRWLEKVDFASQMDDAALAAFKKDVQALGASAGEEMDARLKEEALWLSSASPAAGRKSLEGHAQLWPVLQEAPCKLSALLSKHQLPPDDEFKPEPPYQLVYRSPMYFVDGVYCPGLIETYWGRLDEYSALEEAIAARQVVSSRERLEQRWDQA